MIDGVVEGGGYVPLQTLLIRFVTAATGQLPPVDYFSMHSSKRLLNSETCRKTNLHNSTFAVGSNSNFIQAVWLERQHNVGPYSAVRPLFGRLGLFQPERSAILSTARALNIGQVAHPLAVHAIPFLGFQDG